MPAVAVSLVNPQLWSASGQRRWSGEQPRGRLTHALLPPGTARLMEPVDVPYRRVWQLRQAARDPWFWYYLLGLEGSPDDWHLAWKRLRATRQGMQLRVAVLASEQVERTLEPLPTRPRVLVVPELLDDADSPRALFRASPDASLLNRRGISPWLLLPLPLLALALVWLYYPQSQPQPAPQPVAVVSPGQHAETWRVAPDPVAPWLDRVVQAMPADAVLHSYSAERGGEWRISGLARHEQALQTLRQALPGARLHSAQQSAEGWHFELSGRVR